MQQQSYSPGLHMLGVLSADAAVLGNPDLCRSIFDDTIRVLGLSKIGEVYHGFPGAGFTAVVCLTESHVSIHTWPEFGKATFDVFLSNFERDNSDKVRRFFNAVVTGLQATIVSQQEISR